MVKGRRNRKEQRLIQGLCRDGLLEVTAEDRDRDGVERDVGELKLLA